MACSRTRLPQMNRLAVFLLFPLLTLVFLTGFVAQGVCAQITGTVTLPNSQVAPAGGMYIDIHVNDDNGLVSGGVDTVFLSQGTGSETYTVTVADDAAALWRVSYSYYGSEHFVADGYFSSNGTTWDYNAATLLAGGQDHDSIDLELIAGNFITGTVALPTGLSAPPGGTGVSIDAQNYYDAYESTWVTIPEGSNSASYSLVVPEQVSYAWHVRYWYSGGEAYVPQGYYTDSGTTWRNSLDTTLSIGMDHSDIDLTLIPGIPISGTLSFPSGGAAPAGGFYVHVIAEDSGLYTNDQLDLGLWFAEGDTSQDYILYLPDEASLSWRVGYDNWGIETYLKSGYYASSGTTWDSSAATLLIGGQAYTGIDLTLLTGRTISGTVSLPSGQVAPAGGMDISVNANNDNGTGHGSSSVHIPADSSSADYTMTVPDDASISWRVAYYYRGNEPYLSGGYYSSSGTTWDYNAATLLAGDQDHSGIDLSLLNGNTISGTVSLPSGQVAPAGGMNISVHANNDNGAGYGSSSVYIPADSSSADYTMIVPDEATISWRVAYDYRGNESYLGEGYYSSSGTTWDYYAATLLAGDQDHSGVGLTLLTGRTISGTVSLPSGQVAPAGGMDISVNAYNDNGAGNGSSSVSIPADSSSADYTMTVPDDVAISWRISYSYRGNEPYLSSGYYSSSGTTWDYNAAILLAGDQDHNGIGLTLLTGRTISGTVSLPFGQVAPAGGMNISVSANNTNGAGNGSSSVSIPADSSSADYIMTVPDDAAISWWVSYSYWGNEPYLRDGYHSSSGTTWDYNAATLLAGDQDHSGIGLTLLTGRTISGTVSLPSGQVAPAGGIYLNINANQANELYGSYWADIYVTIPTDSNSVAYSLIVPNEVTTSWKIDYRYWGNEPIVGSGYYSASGTTWDQSAATLLAGGQDYPNINLTLLIGKTITGTLSLPSGQTASAQYSYFITAEEITDQPGTDASTWLFIASGDSSASYTIVVPDVSSINWRVRYSEENMNGVYSGYFPTAYYAAAGTTWKIQEADALAGGIDRSGIDLTLISVPTTTISGSVFLPSGTSETPRWVTIEIYDAVNHSFISTWESFAAGSTSLDYTIDVPLGTVETWRVGYSLNNNITYLETGYYTPTNTVQEYSMAVPLPADQGHSNINMTLIPLKGKFPWSMFLPAIIGGSQ